MPLSNLVFALLKISFLNLSTSSIFSSRSIWSRHRSSPEPTRRTLVFQTAPGIAEQQLVCFYQTNKSGEVTMNVSVVGSILTLGLFLCFLNLAGSSKLNLESSVSQQVGCKNLFFCRIWVAKLRFI